MSHATGLCVFFKYLKSVLVSYLILLWNVLFNSELDLNNKFIFLLNMKLIMDKMTKKIAKRNSIINRVQI